jgi:hypothetical protein
VTFVIRAAAYDAFFQRSDLGEYDRGILCANCDQALGTFDHYAINVCKEFDAKHIRLSADLFELTGFDGEQFAKFVLAVLWRID